MDGFANVLETKGTDASELAATTHRTDSISFWRPVISDIIPHNGAATVDTANVIPVKIPVRVSDIPGELNVE